MSNDAAGFALRCGPLSCSPTWAFDAGLRPGPLPDRAASPLPGSLAITRTGLTPAGDGELPIKSQPLDDHLLITGRTDCRTNRAVRSTLAPGTNDPGWAGLLSVMPPVHRRSLHGSNMNAATLPRDRRTGSCQAP